MFGLNLLSIPAADPCASAPSFNANGIGISRTQVGDCDLCQYTIFTVTPSLTGSLNGCRIRYMYYFGPSSTGTPVTGHTAPVDDAAAEPITMTFYAGDCSATPPGDEGCRDPSGVTWYFRCYAQILGTDGSTVCDTSETDTTAGYTTYGCDLC